MNTNQAKAIFDKAIKASNDPDMVRLVKAFFTDSKFRKAMQDYLYELSV